MSKGGHILIGLSSGLIVVAVGGLTAWPAAAGAIASATLPDLAEGVISSPLSPSRVSIIPHRTVTHWLPVWIGVMIACVMASHISFNIGAAGFGIALGAALHCAVDALSPMGIPIAHPFARRLKIGPVYRTGTLEELRLIGPMAALGLVAAVSILHSI